MRQRTPGCKWMRCGSARSCSSTTRKPPRPPHRTTAPSTGRGRCGSASHRASAEARRRGPGRLRNGNALCEKEIAELGVMSGGAAGPRRIVSKPALRSFNHTQTSRAELTRRRLDDDLYVPAERVQPACEPVNRDALHTAAEHLGKRRLICAAELRRLLLRQLAPRDGIL